MPSSGYGNFIEIGPLNMNLTEREHTWVKNFNLLFIDNPVGVGFSYFSDTSARMVQNNKAIGEDLVSFMKIFLGNYKEFQKIPLYIFGESYGGKMAVEFAYQLVEVRYFAFVFLRGCDRKFSFRKLTKALFLPILKELALEMLIFLPFITF